MRNLMIVLFVSLMSGVSLAQRTEGRCVPAKETPGALFCEQLPQEACESKRYVCEWVVTRKPPVIIR